MIIRRFLLATCFVCFLPLTVSAEAPVVDDSENFALLDEQQANYEQPLAREQKDEGYYSSDEEKALASDSSESSNTNSGGSNAALLDKVQGLQQEIQELRGQLEVQAHDLKLLQQQQLAFYKDLDARLPNQAVAGTTKNVATAPLSIATKTPPPSAAVPAEKQAVQPVAAIIPSNGNRANPADEQISYLAAYELVKNKRFDDALAAMQKFVTQYPQGGYTGNAQYWLGELHLVKKNYTEAIEHFEIVLQQFPSSSKTAASMLKIGYAYAGLGKKDEAIQRLQQVIKNYPDTNTAQLAKTKLEALNS